MIFSLLLAIQTAQAGGFTPQEQRAVTATLTCLRRHIDSIPRRERRQRGELLIEEAFSTCTGEEAALRALLRARLTEQSTEQVLAIVRERSRVGMRRYVGR